MHYQRWRRTGDPLKVRKHKANSGSFRKGQDAWNKGKPMPPKQKDALIEANTGRKWTEDQKKKLKGRIPWNKNQSLSEETRAKIRAARSKQILAPDHGQKISRALKGKPKSAEHVAKLSGSNNYRWQGGTVRNLSKRAWKKLREQVVRRDEYMCQRCGSESQLVAHHITPYQEGGPDSMENLITWCRGCHARHHNPTSFR